MQDNDPRPSRAFAQSEAFCGPVPVSVLDDPPAVLPTQHAPQEPAARLFYAPPTMRGQLVLERIHNPNQER